MGWAGVSVGFVVGVVVRLVLPRRLRAGFAGVVTSVGVAPASAGLATVVPAAAGVCRERRAILRDDENEHGIVAPGTDVNVRRLPDLCARNETICGGVAAAAPAVVVVAPVGTSPVCNATAV